MKKEAKIYVELNSGKVELPNNLNEISIGNGRALFEAYANTPEDNKSVIKAILGCSDKELEGGEDYLLQGIRDVIDLTVNNYTSQLSKFIKIAGVWYGLKDLDNMTTEDYIDIDDKMRNSDNYIDTCLELISLLYSPVISSTALLGIKTVPIGVGAKAACFGRKNYKTSPNRDDLYDLLEDRISMGFAITLGAYVVEYKTMINKNFPKLFSAPKPKKLDEDGNEIVPFQGDIISTSELYGWYDTLYQLVDNNEIQAEAWKKKPIGEFLYWVDYRSTKNKEEIRKLKLNK